MKLRRWLTVAGSATALLGMVALSGPATIAQEATPEAEQAAAAHPVHIHSGNCNELGEVVVPLTDLVAPTGDGVGQRNRAAAAATSFTSVPLTLDAIVADDHSINAHLSADQIDVYIACGELGGVIGPDGSLVVGLREQNDSGFTGIAFLFPGADGASTDISLFIAETGDQRGAGGGADEDAQTAGTDDAATDDAATADAGATDDMGDMGEMEDMTGMDATPAP